MAKAYKAKWIIPSDDNIYTDCALIVDEGKVQEIIKQEDFADKKFVITGTISIMPRDRLKEEITIRGGKTIESVSKNTDVLILGDNPGSKYEKAKELKITIWDEEELKKRLGDINE